MILRRTKPGSENRIEMSQTNNQSLEEDWNTESEAPVMRMLMIAL